MASKPEFAEFVARLSADDAELKADLKSAETQVKASAQKMQGSLDSVGASAGNAGQALGTLGQAAASIGGPIGGVIGQGIAFSQMLTGMGVALTGPIAILAALTAGVFVFREELAEAILKGGEFIGLLEDLGKRQQDNEKVAERLAKRLKEQRIERELRTREGSTAARLRAAQRGESDLAAFDLSQQAFAILSKLPSALRTPENERTIFRILQTEKEIAETLDKQKQTKADLAAFDRETAAMVAERKRKEEELAKAQTIAAQQLLVGLGAARQSEFIDDPTLKRLAQLSEMMSDRDRAAARATPTAGFGGTFGLSRVTSAMSTIRAGDVLGQQSLTVQEQTKQIAADHRDIARETKRILDDIKLQGRMMQGGGKSLVITGNP